MRNGLRGVARLASDGKEPVCTCKVTGPGYDQTKFDPDCYYHGENGIMVAILNVKPPAPKRPFTGGLITRRPCPHCGGDVDVV